MSFRSFRNSSRSGHAVQQQEVFEREWEAINTYVKSVLDGWNLERLPGTLHHFTDVGGLMGIVQERTLHASLATTMNDSTEITHAVNRVMSMLDTPNSSPKGLSVNFVKECLAGKRRVGRLPTEQKHYVVSFCGGIEHALHWLHYGRSGTGMALGFDSGELMRVAQFKLRPVIYDPAQQDEILRGLVQRFDDFYLKHVDFYVKHASADAATKLNEMCSYTLSAFVGQVASMFKHQSFSSEDEWRLVLPEGDPMDEVDEGPDDPNPPEASLYQTRFKTNAAGRLAPYKVVEFKNEKHFKGRFPLTSIVFGASAPMKCDDQAVRVLMQGDRDTFGRVEISVSDVPVRP